MSICRQACSPVCADPAGENPWMPSSGRQPVPQDMAPAAERHKPTQTEHDRPQERPNAVQLQQTQAEQLAMVPTKAEPMLTWNHTDGGETKQAVPQHRVELHCTCFRRRPRRRGGPAGGLTPFHRRRRLRCHGCVCASNRRNSGARHYTAAHEHGGRRAQALHPWATTTQPDA
jgi:hypothetical protein